MFLRSTELPGYDWTRRSESENVSGYAEAPHVTLDNDDCSELLPMQACRVCSRDPTAP